MRRAMVAVLVFLAALWMSCNEENGVGPTPEPPGRQHDIPWPSLADSPWPMGHHDPQSTGRSQYVGGSEGRLFWSKTGLTVWSGVIIDTDGTLYYYCSDSSLVDALYALNPDGSLKWKASLYTTPHLIVKNYTYPILSSDGTIYIISRDGNLYAINRDGSRKWVFTADAPIRTRGLAIGLDGTLYFVSSSGTLYALGGNSSVVWQKFIGQGFWGNVLGPPIVFSPDGQTLYVGASGPGLYALGTDGEVKWFNENADNVNIRLVDSQGNIYAAKGDTLLSFTSGGNLRWRYEGAKDPRGVTMDGDGNLYYVVIANDRSSLLLLSLDNSGIVRWTYPLGGAYWGELICDSEGTVYVGFGSIERRFYAIRSNGSLKWVVSLEDYTDFSSSPAIGADGTIYAPSGSTTNGEVWGVFAFR